MTDSGGAFGGRFPDAVDSVVHAAGVPADRRRRRLGSIGWWVVFIIGLLYFFVPLASTLEFSLRARPNLAAFANVFKDPQFSGSLIYSFVAGILTIVISTVIIVPTAFWVRLKVPRLRPVVELITLLPFVIPPIILVFGLLKTYSGAPFHLTNTDLGSSALLVAGYVILSFPYMYRAVDTGLRAIDVQSLTEASQSLGAGWVRILWQVIFPNLRVALLSGAFLTLAIVIGEFTIATFLARPAFGPYLSDLGNTQVYEPGAVALISFGLTWIAMGFLSILGRGTGGRVQVAGAR
jgi:putative spermidine/putrescine transport system permease protein